MSTRSCLLCGRTLSRWSGSGDDFCSREHRNQYRLRRSMDRLQEANKVASVMRRRESPRPLKAANLVNGGPQEPRGFAEGKTVAPRPPAIPKLSPARPPAMEHTESTVAIPMNASGRRAPLLCPAPPPVRAAVPLAPPIRMGASKPGPQCAPPVRAVASSAAGEHGRRRIMMCAWRASARPVLKKISDKAVAPRVYPVGGEAAPGAMGTVAEANQGRALRVSLSAAFRIPEWKLRPVMLALPPAPGMTWPGLEQLMARPFGPAPQAEPVSMPPSTLLAAPGLRIPGVPASEFETVFRWPAAMDLSLSFANTGADYRTATVPFTSSEESYAKERPHEYRN